MKHRAPFHTAAAATSIAGLCLAVFAPTIHCSAKSDPSKLQKANLRDFYQTVACAQDTDDHELSLLHKLEGHADSINCLAFTPDGKTVASGAGSRDRSIRLWNVESGKLEVQLDTPSTAASAMAFSKDGSTLIVAGKWRDGDDWISGIQLWDIKTKKVRASKETPAFPRMRMAPGDRKMFAVTSSNAEDKSIVVLCDTETAKEVSTLNVGKTVSLRTLAFSRDGKSLAAGRFDGKVQVWNVETGKEIVCFSVGKEELDELVFTPDGKRLVVGQHSEYLQMYDVATGKLSFTLENKRCNPDNCLEYSPNGKLLAAATGRGIRLLDERTIQTVHSARYTGAEVKCIAISPDGKLLAAGGRGNHIEIWTIPPSE
jgi:WD40 repeat protein